MTAWQILVSNSSLQSGDAWAHLNNQIGGGEIVEVEVLRYVDGDWLESEIIYDELSELITDAAEELGDLNEINEINEGATHGSI